MISKVKRYFLEIKDFSNPIELNIPKNYKIILDEKKDFQYNKFFYKQIGADHYWRDRLGWSEQQWFRYVQNDNLETHILKKGKGENETFLITNPHHARTAFERTNERTNELLVYPSAIANQAPSFQTNLS